VGTLGVLGGGQLGLYFVIAARSMGYETVVLDPDPEAPAGRVADTHLVAGYEDEAALLALAERCDAVTVEFENPAVSSLRFLEQRITVRPSSRAVAVGQDRRLEKSMCRELGLATAPFEVIETDSDVRRVVAGGPTDRGRYVLKTARLGYDGRGQERIATLDSLAGAWARTGKVPCILESMVPLDAEFSVILARDTTGNTAVYAPTQNTHVNGILDVSSAPYGGPAAGGLAVVDEGRRAALLIAQHLEYVGVMAVEFFVSGGELLVNEMAPRPHNSGHWTMDAARTSQFDQQVRALAGLPLGDTAMLFPAVSMVNILGDMWAAGEPGFGSAAPGQGTHVHLYGKSSPRSGRKMGHMTVTGDSIRDTESRARQSRADAEPR
jgi:5-(carboxyamino)imidazole ribonucleotide synthase